MSLRWVVFSLLQQPTYCKAYTAPLLWPLRSLIRHNNIHSHGGTCLFLCVMYTVYSRSAISLVRPTNPKTQTRAQKHCVSESRPSFRRWRGWHARLDNLPRNCVDQHAYTPLYHNLCRVCRGQRSWHAPIAFSIMWISWTILSSWLVKRKLMNLDISAAFSYLHQWWK